MTKEMAQQLLGSKDVYLTEEGRQLLEDIIEKGDLENVSTNSQI